jgi:hypothetical protein
MTTIFSSRIAIGNKSLFTMRTDKIIVGLAIYPVQMAVPPLHPAFIRTELFLLSSRTLFYFLATVPAEMITICQRCYRNLSYCNSRQIFASAKGFHRIY